jgi:hypothetical protein
MVAKKVVKRRTRTRRIRITETETETEQLNKTKMSKSLGKNHTLRKCKNQAGSASYRIASHRIACWSCPGPGPGPGPGPERKTKKKGINFFF